METSEQIMLFMRDIQPQATPAEVTEKLRFKSVSQTRGKMERLVKDLFLIRGNAPETYCIPTQHIMPRKVATSDRLVDHIGKTGKEFTVSQLARKFGLRAAPVSKALYFLVRDGRLIKTPKVVRNLRGDKWQSHVFSAAPNWHVRIPRTYENKNAGQSLTTQHLANVWR